MISETVKIQIVHKVTSLI